MSEEKHATPQNVDAASDESWEGGAPFKFRQRPAETDSGTLLGWIMGAIKVVLMILAVPAFMVGGVLLISGFDDGCPAGMKGFVRYSGSMARGVSCVPDPASPARARGAGSSGSYAVERSVGDFAERFPEIIESWKEQPKADLKATLLELRRDSLKTPANISLFTTLPQKSGGTGQANSEGDGGIVKSPSSGIEQR